MTYLHPRVNAIVCVADAIRTFFWNMRLLGIPAPVKKARTIYKGHDEAWYQTKPISLTQYGIPSNRFVVGCTVNDRPRKGLSQLIAAMDALPNDLPIHLLLIGNIRQPQILQAIKNSQYNKNIHLIGTQNNAPAIIKNCDVCVLPAIKREGLPKGIIEGMIQEVAPIVTDSGGSPELIEHEQSGLVVPPMSPTAIAGAIMKYYTNRSFLKAAQKEAKKRIINDFNIRSTIKQHIGLYQELVESCD